MSVVNNLLEKIIHNQLSTYLEENYLLNDCQYSFRKGCGTEEAVINVQNCICKMIDEGNSAVVGIFFDLSKAFDMIDHEILIQKLKLYGVRGNELLLFQSYLGSRRQVVQVHNEKCSFGPVEFGVPQGSFLGPLLFVIYMNDIKNLKLTGKMYMYADHISIFYPYKYEDAVKAYIDRDVALIVEYMRINKLFLNPDKTKLIRFRPVVRFNSNFSVHIDGKEIEEVSSIK